MRKSLVVMVALLVWLTSFCGVNFKAQTAARPSDFSDDFERYVVGDYIENDSSITSKWENNVLLGGDPLLMDSHLKQIAKVEYESGTNGNKVLHLKNVSGADSFFYLGVGGDFRVKNFVAEYRLKYLAEGVKESSWVGLSFRKRADSFYTTTNNLLLTTRRYVASTAFAGQSYAIFNGGGVTGLAESGALFGDSLSLEMNNYTMPATSENADSSWVNIKYEVNGNNYKVYANDTLVTNLTFNVKDFDYYGYLSLNCCSANVLIDDFSVKVTDTEAPPAILPLPTPEPVLDKANGVIKWAPIEGVFSYNININGKDELIFTNSYKLSKLQKVGDYKITVTALSEDQFINKNSAESSTVTYSVKAPEKKSGCASSSSILVVSGAMIIGAFLKRRMVK